MASQQSRAIKAPLGWVAVNGQASIKVSDVSVSMSASEITSRRGCDKTYWYRAVDLTDWTGSFVSIDRSPLLLSLATGGTLNSTGYTVVNDELQTVTTQAVSLDNGNVLTDVNGLMVGSVVVYDSNGETVLKQIDPTGTPGSGEFDITNATTGALGFHSDQDDATVKVSYAYTNSNKTSTSVNSDDAAGYVSLLLPACAVRLDNPNNEDPVGYYFPRVRIIGFDDSAAGGGELQGVTYSFVAVPDGNGLVVQYV